MLVSPTSWVTWASGLRRGSGTSIGAATARDGVAPDASTNPSPNRQLRFTSRPLTSHPSLSALRGDAVGAPAPLGQVLAKLVFERECFAQLLSELVRFFALSARARPITFGRQQRRLDPARIPVVLQRERLVHVFEPGVEVLLDLQHVAGGVRVGAPRGLELVDPGQHLAVGVDRYRERQRQLLPRELEHRALVAEVGERERQPFAVWARLWAHLDPYEIGVGGRGSGASRGTRCGRLGQRHRPVTLARRDVKKVAAGGDRPATELNLPAEANFRRLAGGDRPALVPGHGGAPDLATVYRRARILDRNVGQTHPLRHRGRRALTRQLDLGRARVRRGQRQCGGSEPEDEAWQG